MFKKTIAARVLMALALTGLPSAVLADPLERYSELQAVVEAINDPDPLMRLALLEEVIAKGDATEVQLAIRTAFTIDDPNVRSLALRAHFASFRTVVITAEFPEQLQTAIDAGGDALEAARNGWGNHFGFMDYLGRTFTFQTKYDGSSPEFVVYSLNGRSTPDAEQSGNGNIKGAVVTLQSSVRVGRNSAGENCTFEFTKYVGFTITGVGSCDWGSTLPFPVTLHLFEPDDSAPVAEALKAKAN